MRDEESQAPYQIRDRRWWVREGDEGERGGESAGKPTVIASLEAELADRDRRLRETVERHHQLVDEMSRARQRIERDADREVERRRRELLVSLLPVLDDLDRAISAARQKRPAGSGAAAVAPPSDPLLSGVELVRSGFLDRLRALGVERDDPTGRPFDPAHHEAVSVVEVEPDQAGQVVATVSPGYRIGDEILRPARVVVSRARPSAVG